VGLRVISESQLRVFMICFSQAASFPVIMIISNTFGTEFIQKANDFIIKGSFIIIKSVQTSATNHIYVTETEVKR